MRISATALILTFALLLSSFCAIARGDATPTLHRVMEGYVNAIGGRDLLGKIRTQVAVTDVQLLGRNLTVTTTAKVPVYFLQVTQAEGSSLKISVGFDGKTAWTQGLDGSVSVLSGSRRAGVVAEAAGANSSEIFPERWPTNVSLKPNTTIDGISYYVLNVRPKDGVAYDFFLDQHTFRPMMQRTVESDGASASIVAGFTKGPLGELYANSLRTTRSDGLTVTETLRSLKDNVDVSDSIFAPALGKGTETI